MPPGYYNLFALIEEIHIFQSCPNQLIDPYNFNIGALRLFHQQIQMLLEIHNI